MRDNNNGLELNNVYQQQFETQAYAVNEEKRRLGLGQKGFWRRAMRRLFSTQVSYDAVDMAQVEASRVNELIDTINSSLEGTPQEKSEIILGGKEFGVKQSTELEAGAALKESLPQVVSMVYDSELDGAWVEFYAATRMMGSERGLSLKLALANLIKDHVDTSIRLKNTTALNKLAFENSIESIGGLGAFQEFPKDIVESADFKNKLKGHIESAPKAYEAMGYGFDKQAEITKGRADLVAQLELMTPEQVQAIIDGEVIQGFCRDGIESTPDTYVGYDFKTQAQQTKDRADLVAQLGLMDRVDAEWVMVAILDKLANK